MIGSDLIHDATEACLIKEVRPYLLLYLFSFSIYPDSCIELSWMRAFGEKGALEYDSTMFIWEVKMVDSEEEVNNRWI